jgi:hypothetical protein
VISEMARGDIFIRTDDEFAVVKVLNVVEAEPKSDNTALEIMGIDYANGMNIDRKFNGRRRIRDASVLQN